MGNIPVEHKEGVVGVGGGGDGRGETEQLDKRPKQTQWRVLILSSLCWSKWLKRNVKKKKLKKLNR